MTKAGLKKTILLVLLAPLILGSMLAVGCLQTRVLETVSPQEAFDLIQENQDSPDFVILDVRRAGEYAQGHIEAAINMDFYSPTFRDELDALDKEKTYLIYCRSGGRSGQALGIMDELGFLEIYDLSGGISAWQDAGLPTVE